jgi:hypothetical protein
MLFYIIFTKIAYQSFIEMKAFNYLLFVVMLDGKTELSYTSRDISYNKR